MLNNPANREIIATYADGTVVVYGDPSKINQSPSTTEIRLEEAAVLVHKLEPRGKLWVATRLDIVTGTKTTELPIETRLTSDPEINPQSTVLSGPGRWNLDTLGNMWGIHADIVLAERLLGIPVQSGLRAMVEPSLVRNIRARLTTRT